MEVVYEQEGSISSWAVGGRCYYIAIGYAKKGYNVIAVDGVEKSFEDKNIEFYQWRKSSYRWWND